MSKLKLYTEEQVKQAIELSRVILADGSPYPKYIILSEIKGIELPSDEEIVKEMDKLPFSKHVDDGLYNDGQLMGFELGAKWLKEQILNQNK